MNSPAEPPSVPGKLVVVRGRQQRIHVTGQGTPAVVFEAAIGDFGLTWALVQPGVAQFTTAVSYDRAGLGWSDSSSEPREGKVMVEELREVLDAAAIPRPVVLVGHSFSGMLVRLYAYLYPDEVAGLVLVDGAHEDQFQRFPPEIGGLFPTIRAAQVQQLRGLGDTIAHQGSHDLPPLVMVPPGFPPDLAATYAAQSVARPSGPLTMAAELDALETTQAQVRSARATLDAAYPLGDVPLMVLSHGVPQPVPGMPDAINEAYEAAAAEMQEEQAALSRRGRRIIVEGAGHMIHHDQPDAVVAAVRSIIEAARE